MQKLWFKAKDYGWGWYPVTWQGILITLLYIAGLALLYYFCFAKFFRSPEKNPPGIVKAGVIFFGGMAVLTLVLIFIAYKKGEKPSWRWGNKAPQSSQENKNDHSS